MRSKLRRRRKKQGLMQLIIKEWRESRRGRLRDPYYRKNRKGDDFMATRDINMINVRLLKEKRTTKLEIEKEKR